MRRDNGVLPALGVAAAMAALGAWGSRGSSNDDWGLVPAGQRRPARGGRRGGMVPRHAPSDRDLLMQAMTGGDPLGGMAPAQAAQDDPRRIIARIDQIVMPAFFAPMMGAMPQQGEHLQIPPMMRDQALANEARMWKTVRDLSGGLPSVKAWTTMVTDNIDQTLRRTAEMLPPGAHRMYLQHIDAFQRVFDQAADMVAEVARGTDDYDERLDWTALSDALRAYPATMQDVFSRAAQGRLGGPGGRRGIAGPGRRRLGGGNRHGSGYR
jgi:hypothetical protein